MIYTKGDKSKGVCFACKRVQPTTLALRNLPLRSTGELVKSVLAWVCDVCGEAIGYPHQDLKMPKKELNE